MDLKVKMDNSDIIGKNTLFTSVFVLIPHMLFYKFLRFSVACAINVISYLLWFYYTPKGVVRQHQKVYFFIFPI